jgi:NAD-dependent DNA ligase
MHLLITFRLKRVIIRQIMAPELYKKFHKWSQLDKSVNSLLGLVQGVAIDGKINGFEINLLNLWLSEHQDLANKHPFNELIPVLAKSLSDGVFNYDEQQDIIWLCEKLRSTEYFNEITADLQLLHGILGGIASDGVISPEELRGLRDWLDSHDHLRSCYPYDEIDSLIISALADGKVDEQENKLLQAFFSEFIAILDNKTITAPLMTKDLSVQGVCASCPEIIFEGSKFCFTGASNRYTRSEFESLIGSLGGVSFSSVSNKLNYLVIGAEGNGCWAFACYGRKVEKAVELRKQGARLLIVHENDFHDAVADQ